MNKLICCLIAVTLGSAAQAAGEKAKQKTTANYIACLNNLNDVQAPSTSDYRRLSADSHYIFTKNGGANLTDSTTVSPGFLHISNGKVENCEYRAGNDGFQIKHNGQVITQPADSTPKGRVFEVTKCRDITGKGSEAMIENRIGAMARNYAAQTAASGERKSKAQILKTLSACKGMARIDVMVQEGLSLEKKSELEINSGTPVQE